MIAPRIGYEFHWRIQAVALGYSPISFIFMWFSATFWENKIAFQWNAYRPLVGRIPAFPVQGGVSLGGVCPGGCLPGAGVSQHAMGQTSPCGQADTCENITFTNFVCGWYSYTTSSDNSLMSCR